MRMQRNLLHLLCIADTSKEVSEALVLVIKVHSLLREAQFWHWKTFVQDSGLSLHTRHDFLALPL